ncbi:baculoviral IAP repeat-containing protein 5-like [Lineus longissimus]|uniref:baculoviral IAP repeat-containing protein 5-like n=1 Tax=Lineus longissimus TaxID=88925 RepID=UPI002B4DAF50
MKNDQNALDIYFIEKRLETFKSWPFEENCFCTAEKMAEAGFIHCQDDNEPDVVKCFICYKTLDGWEPEDDPWDEHKRHAPQCGFVKLNNKELTVEDILKLESQRLTNEFMEIVKSSQKTWEAYAGETKETMENIV